jgi:hypothetical protein
MDPWKDKRRDDPRNSSNIISSFSTERVDYDDVHAFSIGSTAMRPRF